MINEIKKRVYSGIFIVLGLIGAVYAILNFAPYIDFILVILTVIGLVVSLIIFFMPVRNLKKNNSLDKKVLSWILLIMAIIGFVYSIFIYDFLKFDMLLLITFIIGFIIILLLLFEPIGNGKKNM